LLFFKMTIIFFLIFYINNNHNVGHNCPAPLEQMYKTEIISTDKKMVVVGVGAGGDALAPLPNIIPKKSSPLLCDWLVLVVVPPPYIMLLSLQYQWRYGILPNKHDKMTET